jgi:hypothetical protein
MSERLPLLFLHGIRGSRLAVETETGPEIIWQLADEAHPRAPLLALLHDADGTLRPADPTLPVYPLDLEPEVYGPFLEWANQRGGLHAPAWDWRLEPGRVASMLAEELPHNTMDVVLHSMGLHVLCELVMGGALPLERIRRLVLVAPAFGGALDILHVLLSGCDREADGADATGRAYGHLVRSLPSLYRLLPVPGYGLLRDGQGQERDPLHFNHWPEDALGDEGRHADHLRLVLEGARRDRARLLAFSVRLQELGDRVLVLAGTGQPTPVGCAMTSERMSCQASHLQLDPAGDGRLALLAQQALGHRLPMEVIGDEQSPVPHGDILRREGVLSRIGAHLDREP